MPADDSLLWKIPGLIENGATTLEPGKSKEAWAVRYTLPGDSLGKKLTDSGEVCCPLRHLNLLTTARRGLSTAQGAPFRGLTHGNWNVEGWWLWGGLD